MKIDNIKINGFGKLENKEIELKDNINIIYGKNESGKSTLLKFIFSMFYGINKNKNGKDISDYDKYYPWKIKEFSGKLKYTLQNKKKFEIFRDFTSKKVKLYNENFEDISKDYTIDKTKGNLFFYEQTKLDEDYILSTAIIEQQEIKIEKSKQNILVQKISNLTSTGKDNLSFNKIITKLKNKITDEIGTNKTISKPININEEKLDKIQEEEKKIKQKKENLQYFNNEKKQLLNKIENFLRKKELIEEVIIKKEQGILETEKILINKKLLEEYNQKIKNNEINKITDLKNSQFKDIWILIIFLIILITASIILKFNIYIKLVLIFINICLIIFRINVSKKQKNKMKQINENNNKIKEKTEELKNSRDKIQEEINFKELKIKEDFIQFSKEIENKCYYIDNNEIKEILTRNVEDLKNSKIELENTYQEIKIKLKTIEIEEKNVLTETEKLPILMETKEKLEEERNELIFLKNSINIAKEGIVEAYEKMKENITPEFEKNLSLIVNKISNKYKKVKFVDGEGLLVEIEDGNYINCEKLSVGTIDQMYLALRLAILKEISEENMPIIFDEAFAYYDTERLKNILQFLSEEFEQSQILLFTCTNREEKILEEINIKYNKINLM